MKKWPLFALLPLLWMSCAKPESFDFIGISSIRVKNFSFSDAALEVTGSFYNPNKYPVQLKDAAVDLIINEIFLGQTLLDSTLIIPAKDTFHLPVTMNVKLAAEQIKLVGKLMSGQREFDVELKGKTKIGRGGVFINYPIQYKGTQMIEL